MARREHRTGSISELPRRPRVWRLRISTPAGQVSRTFHATKDADRGGRTQARAALEEFRTDLEAQKAASEADDSPALTLADLLDEWMAHQKRQDLAPATLETYATHIRLRIKPRLGAIPLSDLTARDL